MESVSRPARGRLPEAALSRANRVLAEVVGEVRCPFCQGMQWLTPHRGFLLDAGGGEFRYTDDESGGATETGMDVVVRVCRRCGFARSHVARVLDRQPEV